MLSENDLPHHMPGENHGLADSQGRGSLLHYCVELVDAKAPRGFIIENVANLTRAAHQSVFNELLSLLEKCACGYVVCYKACVQHVRV